MTKWTGIIVALLLAGGCAPQQDMGVLEVHISLAPPHEPEDNGPLDAAEFAGASGSIDIDVVAGEGSMMAMELPLLPSGWEYVPVLRFIDAPREDLGEESGHGQAEKVAAAHADGPEYVIQHMALMTDDGGESWMHELAQDEVPVDMGGCRMGHIYAVPVGGDAEFDGYEVLRGEVSLTPKDGAAEEEGGHAHGA